MRTRRKRFHGEYEKPIRTLTLQCNGKEFGCGAVYLIKLTEEERSTSDGKKLSDFMKNVEFHSKKNEETNLNATTQNIFGYKYVFFVLSQNSDPYHSHGTFENTDTMSEF